MTNPIADISDPAILRALVQDGVKCEECGGTGWKSTTIGATLWGDSVDREIAGMPRSTPTKVPCTTCNGSGNIPLSNPDLDALAACWCEGEWVRRQGAGADQYWQYPVYYKNRHGQILFHLWETLKYHPTTSPNAAMRLMVKYRLDMLWAKDRDFAGEIWHHDYSITRVFYSEDELCRAITTTALIAALTEAMEG